MKLKNKILIVFCLGISCSSLAQDLELFPIRQMLSQVQSQTFTFQGHGLLFGFNSLHSCLYTSKDLIALKHYCYPKKNYPAKGYKVISTQYGVIDFYEETLPSGSVKVSKFLSIIETLEFNLTTHS